VYKRQIPQNVGVIFKGDDWYATSSVEYINDKARDNPTGKVGIGD